MTAFRRWLLLGVVVCLVAGALVALGPRAVALWREARAGHAFAAAIPERLGAWVAWQDTLGALADAPRWPWRTSLRVAALRDGASPERLPELALEADLEPGARGHDFRLRATGLGGRLALVAQGHVDLALTEADAELRLEPLRFEPGKLSPSDLSPLLTGLVRSVRGGVEAAGRVRWTAAAGPQGHLDIGLRDLDVTTDAATLERLNGVVRVEGPAPLRTPPGQLVSMARVDLGLELTDGLVSFQLRPDGQVELESAEWKLAGGRLHTSGRVDPAAPEQAIRLRVEGVRLEPLLALVAVDGLAGEGVVGGELPLVRKADGFEIRGGRLAATGQGRVRWDPGPAAAGIAAQAPGFDVLVAALANFHYEELTLDIDGDPRAQVDMRLHLAGANPEYKDGHPVELNVNLDARIGDLFRAQDLSYRVPEEIEKRLRTLAEGGGLQGPGGGRP